MNYLEKLIRQLSLIDRRLAYLEASDNLTSQADHTHIEVDVTDLDHDAQKIKSKPVDAPVVNNRALIYDSAQSKFIYASTPIGDAQFIRSKAIDAPLVGDDGKVLTYNYALSKYEHIAKAGSVHGHPVADLTDHNKTVHDALLINADTLDTKHAADLANAVHTHVEVDVTDLDHDAQKIKSKPVDAPVSGNNNRALIYDSAQSKFIYASTSIGDAQFIRSKPVDAPVAADDGRPLIYDHTGSKFDYGTIFVPLTTPLTSTSWDGNAYSDVNTSTVIDLSAVFGVPAGIKAVLLSLATRDSATWGTASLAFDIGPSSTYYYCLAVYPAGGDVLSTNTGVIPCDSNGDIWYQINASGTLTMDCWIRIWGYWI